VLLRSTLEQVTHRIVVWRRPPSLLAAARIYVSSEGGLRFLGRGMTQVDPALAARCRNGQARRHVAGHRRQRGTVSLGSVWIIPPLDYTDYTALRRRGRWC